MSLKNFQFGFIVKTLMNSLTINLDTDPKAHHTKKR